MVESRIRAEPCSRGSSIEKLKTDEKWNHGPGFLRKEESCWPKQEKKEMVLKEERRTRGYTNLSNQTKREVDQSDILSKTWKEVKNIENIERLDPERFSDWDRLCRVTAWIQRFVNNSRGGEKKDSGVLSLEEIENAKIKWIRVAQQNEFSQDLMNGTVKGKIASLCPTIDNQGIIRSNSRIVHAEYLCFNAKYPIILPRDSRVTELIIKKAHEKGNHVRGTNGILADLSSKF